MDHCLTLSRIGRASLRTSRASGGGAAVGYTIAMRLPRRGWLVAACLAVAFGLLLGWGMRPDPTATITHEQYERIHLGMSTAEVMRAVGIPPCRNTDPELRFYKVVEREGPPLSADVLVDSEFLIWQDEKTDVRAFMFRGHVHSKGFLIAEPDPNPPRLRWLRRAVDRLRRRIGL